MAPQKGRTISLEIGKQAYSKRIIRQSPSKPYFFKRDVKSSIGASLKSSVIVYEPGQVRYEKTGGKKNMRNQLTRSDIQKMEEEIEHRKLVVRKEAIEAVKEARAQGDLSENFEYYAAKKYKNQNESRIRYLERMIKTAEVFEDSSAQDEVGMNNTVEVYFEEDDVVETYRIVTTVRENSLQGLISVESPIGKAIYGKKVGDRVKVTVNEKYEYYVVIRSITKTEDDSGDRIRSF